MSWLHRVCRTSGLMSRLRRNWIIKLCFQNEIKINLHRCLDAARSVRFAENDVNTASFQIHCAFHCNKNQGAEHREGLDNIRPDNCFQTALESWRESYYAKWDRREVAVLETYNACIEDANDDDKPGGDVDVDPSYLVERQAWNEYHDWEIN